MLKRLLVAVLFLSFCPAVAGAAPRHAAPGKAPAANTAPAVGDISDADLQGLIDTLDNPDKLKAFVGTLKAAQGVRKAQAEEAKRQAAAQSPDAQAAGAELVAGLAGVAVQAGQRVGNAFGLADEVPPLLDEYKALLADPAGRAQAEQDAIRLVAAVSGGLAALLLARMILRRWRARVRGPAEASGHVVERGVAASLLFGLDVVPLAVLGVVAAGFLSVAAGGAAGGAAADLGVDSASSAREWTSLIVGAVVAFGLLGALVRTLLLPASEGVRVLPLPPETAQYLAIWIRRLGGLAVLGHFLPQAFWLIGLSDDGADVIRKAVGFLFAALFGIFLLQNRQPVAQFVRVGFKRPHSADDDGEAPVGKSLALEVVRGHLAFIWHILAVIYVAAVYIVWAADIPSGFFYMVRATALTAVAVGAAMAAAAVLRLALERTFSLTADQRRRFPGLETRANRYIPVLNAVLRWTLTLATAAAVAQAWGLDLTGWVGTGFGQRVVHSGFSITITLLLAFLFWALVGTWIERYLTEVDDAGRAVHRSGRIKTLLPLLRNVIFVLLLTVVGLVVLDDLGVNIAPLLAGAGVIGLAVGFGSQKLVQDVITGAFMLFEDTIAVGDVADVSGHTGVVESLSIRSLRLRDGAGAVHTIPFSTVTSVTNHTKGHSYAVWDVSVSYQEDADRVVEILRAVGEDLYQDPAFEYDVQESLEIIGVERFSDAGVVIGARMRTRPGRQWAVKHEFLRRLKIAFDKAGVLVPTSGSTTKSVGAVRQPDVVATTPEANPGPSAAATEEKT